MEKSDTAFLFFKTCFLCFILLCQPMLEAQNKRIDDLMERIRLQQEKLDKQNVRIRTLHSQVRLPYEPLTHKTTPR